MPETTKESFEKAKSPAETKAESAVSSIVLNNISTLENWQTADETIVQEIKKQLAAVVGLQSADDIVVRAHMDRAGLSITVTSKTNPLLTHYDAHMRQGASTFESFKLAPRTDEVGNDYSAILTKALELPATYESQHEKDTYADVHSTTPTTTIYKIIDRQSKVVIGFVEVNEETKQIGRVKRDEAALERIQPKPLVECMKAFAQYGRLRDPNVKKMVEQAIRKELNLQGFENRPLLLTAKPGKDETVLITVEDKETETVIAEMEYALKFEFFGSVSINSKEIRKVLADS